MREDGLYSFTPEDRLSWGLGDKRLLDSDGTLVVPTLFDYIGVFPEDEDPNGLAWAGYLDKSGKKSEGFINRHGEFVLIQQRSMF